MFTPRVSSIWRPAIFVGDIIVSCFLVVAVGCGLVVMLCQSYNVTRVLSLRAMLRISFLVLVGILTSGKYVGLRRGGFGGNEIKARQKL